MTQLDLELFDDMVIGNIFSDAWKATKSVIKSPITKAIVGGVAVVFPPVGLPAAAALVTADQVVRASESKDPKVRAKAKAMIAATGKLAKAGNTHAQAALKTMVVAKAARYAAPGSAGPSAARISTASRTMTDAQKKAAAAAAGRAMAASMAARSSSINKTVAAKAAAGSKVAQADIARAGWLRSAEGQYKRAS